MIAHLQVERELLELRHWPTVRRDRPGVPSLSLSPHSPKDDLMYRLSTMGGTDQRIGATVIGRDRP